MNTNSIFDNRLRPAIEFVPAFFALSAAILLYLQPDWFLPILKIFSNYVIIFMLGLGLFRFYQGTKILQYRASLKQLPRYVLAARQIPTYRKKLFLGKGFKDTFRELHPKKIQYSWWSYRANARANNVGWRIDYFCVSNKILKKISQAFILDKVLGSDHAPVGITIDK